MAKPLLRFLDLQVHHHPIDILGELNGIISGITLFPQLYKAITSASLEGLSITTFVLIFLNSAVWIAYALHRKLSALFISSCLNAAASLGIALAILQQ